MPEYDNLLSLFERLAGREHPGRERAIRVQAAASHPAVQRWRPLVEKYFPPEDVDNILAIMLLESWGQPGAQQGRRGEFNLPGREDSRGLLQINMAPRREALKDLDLYDPETNIRIGADIWKQQGYSGGWKDNTRNLRLKGDEITEDYELNDLSDFLDYVGNRIPAPAFTGNPNPEPAVSDQGWNVRDAIGLELIRLIKNSKPMETVDPDTQIQEEFQENKSSPWIDEAIKALIGTDLDRPYYPMEEGVFPSQPIKGVM